MLPDWIKHAFAVAVAQQPPAETELQLVDRISREVVRRRMTTPALAFLEMARPLNYLGSQTMHFFAPLASALLDSERYGMFAKFLERRDALEILCRRIEELEQTAGQQASPGSDSR